MSPSFERAVIRGMSGIQRQQTPLLAVSGGGTSVCARTMIAKRCCTRAQSLPRPVSTGPAALCILPALLCPEPLTYTTVGRSRPVCGRSPRWSGRRSRRSGSSIAVERQCKIMSSDIGKRTCMVSAVFPTPPSPSTTSLYRVIFP